MCTNKSLSCLSLQLLFDCIIKQIASFSTTEENFKMAKVCIPTAHLYRVLLKTTSDLESELISSSLIGVASITTSIYTGLHWSLYWSPLVSILVSTGL